MPQFLIGQDDKVRIHTPAGTTISVSPDEAQRLLSKDASLVPESLDEFQERAKAEHYDSPLKALGLGAARGLTLGASDWALKESGAMSPEDIAGYEQYNPASSIGGEIGGSVLGALIPGAPLGLAGRGVEAALLGGRAAQSVGTAARLGVGAARAATEGALIGAGEGVSDMAVHGAGFGDVLEKAGLGAGLGAATFGVGELVGMGARRAGGSLTSKIKGMFSSGEKIAGEQANLETLLKNADDLAAKKAAADEHYLQIKAAHDELDAKAQEFIDLKRGLESEKKIIPLRQDSIKEQLARLRYADPSQIKDANSGQLNRILNNLTEEQRAKVLGPLRETLTADNIELVRLEPYGDMFNQLKGQVKLKTKGPRELINDQLIDAERSIAATLKEKAQIKFKNGGLVPTENEIKRLENQAASLADRIAASKKQIEKLTQERSPAEKFVQSLVSSHIPTGGHGLGGGIVGQLIMPVAQTVARPVIKGAVALGKAAAPGVTKAAPYMAAGAEAAVPASLYTLSDGDYQEFQKDIHAIAPEHVEALALQMAGPQDRAVKAAVDSVRYLQQTIKPPALPTVPTAAQPRPAYEDKLKAAKAIAYVEKPDLALKEFAEKRGTPEGLDYLAAVKPDVLAAEREKLASSLRLLRAEGKALPDRVAEQVALFLGEQVPGLKNPETVATLQQLYSARKPETRGGIRAAPKNYSKTKVTEYQRLMEANI